jgi:hypothetical protein
VCVGGGAGSTPYSAHRGIVVILHVDSSDGCENQSVYHGARGSKSASPIKARRRLASHSAQGSRVMRSDKVTGGGLYATGLKEIE